MSLRSSPAPRALAVVVALTCLVAGSAGLQAQDGKDGPPAKPGAQPPAGKTNGEPKAPDVPKDLFARKGKCADCHVDDGWDRIKAPPAESFDHASTGFPLRGAHTRVACERCHGRGLSALTASCDSCHHDPHAGQNGVSCERCHTEQTWAQPRNLIAHERTRFPLTGAHAAIQCEACHRPRRAEPLQTTPLECAACHQRAFRRARPNHVGANFLDCGQCHTTSSWRGARYVHRVYILDGRHAFERCVACHTGAEFAGLASGGQACGPCHESDYQRTAGIGGTVPNHPASNFPRTCRQCHDDTRDTWDIASVPG